jgi:hypothetical protein
VFTTKQPQVGQISWSPPLSPLYFSSKRSGSPLFTVLVCGLYYDMHKCTRIEHLHTQFLHLRWAIVNRSTSFCLVMIFTLLLELMLLLLTTSRCAGVQASSEMALWLHCDSMLSPSTRSQQGSSQQHRRSLPGTWAGLVAPLPLQKMASQLYSRFSAAVQVHGLASPYQYRYLSAASWQLSRYLAGLVVNRHRST